MTLNRETPEGFVPWIGEVIAEIRHPLNIEELWPEGQLAELGLYPDTAFAAADPVPADKISLGLFRARVDGQLKWVHTLIDAPEPEPQRLADLKPYQFWAVMRATGHEAGLRAWVDGLNYEAGPNYDPLAWAHASAIIDFSLEYRRDHPLVEAAREVIGVSETELDDLWRYAATL